MDNLKLWSNKPMNMKLFVGGVFSMILFYLLYLLTASIYDSDMYFLIATGREIIENGFLYENIWTIEPGCKIVVQQWLYDVLLAYVDKFGLLGFSTFCGIQFILLVFLMWKFLTIRKISFGVSCLSLFVTLMFSQIYLFSLRPELITLILLLGECLALEYYKTTNKSKYLFWLPILMLLEINLHGSMWPIHYALVLAYVVPCFYLPGTRPVAIYKKLKDISFYCILMTLVMFLNPYGLDGILYIVKSFVANTFKYVKIVEIAAPEIISTCGTSIIIGIVLLFLCHRFQVLRSNSTNIAFGFLCLAATAVRHNMFTFFVLLYLLRDLSGYLDRMSDKFDWKKDVKNNLYPLLIVGNIFFIGLFYSSVTNMFVTDVESVGNQLSSMHNYIVENSSEDARVFTGFNCGAYFEYKGLTNIYMDARPELYTSEFTGGKNLLRDYSRYALYGYSTVIETPQDNTAVSSEEMNEWFYSYDFDYVIVCYKTEMNLAAFMRDNDDYRLIDELAGDTYLLYERK